MILPTLLLLSFGVAGVVVALGSTKRDLWAGKMRLVQLLFAAGLIVSVMTAVRADQVLVELKPIGSSEECDSALGVFEWACANFDDPSWAYYIRRLDGEDKGYWDKYSAATARVDLDGDGDNDLILQVISSLTCGMKDCDTHFLFADQSTSKHPLSYEVSGPYRPATIVLRQGDGRSEVRFKIGTKWFNVSEMKLNMRNMWVFK